MTASPTTPAPKRKWFRRATVDETAAGIYGTVVGAAVMAASHAETAAATVLAVGFSLVVYWAAERYARLVAERIHDGRALRWEETRAQLGSGWEVVTASGLPLAVLAVFAASGAALSTAVIAGLICSTVLLCIAGWEIGHRGNLSLAERVTVTAVAGAFGGLMVLLKTLLH
ncbi:MAG TPA: hypothetical protein VFY58_08780 [Nocardioides sp.]|nr:hypothetical protein [Nocardioides sp.]